MSTVSHSRTRSRWRARHVDDQGRERAKAFVRKGDARRWLDNEITAKFATGTYIAPEAGKVTVEEVRELWERSRGHIKARTAAARRGAWKNRVAPVWAADALRTVPAR